MIALDQAPRHLTDIDAEQMFRKVEIELALQQEVQRLSPKEKEWILSFMKMNYKAIQKHFCEAQKHITVRIKSGLLRVFLGKWLR